MIYHVPDHQAPETPRIAMATHEQTRKVTGPRIGPAVPPISIGLVWADGTRFRVAVYTVAEYEAMPEGERPDGLLDDSGRAMICFIAAD